ncbi:sulfatase/phosphatase domain-containing protein, partial [Akkermansia sp.]
TVLPIGPLGEVGCRDGYGPMWAAVSNTPYRQYKIETFDGGLSAPFIIRYPKVLRPGTRYHAPFLLQDIAPTCLTWAKLSVPSHMDGKPLNSYWSKPASIPPEKVWDSIPNSCPPRTIFWEHQRNRAALTDKFKLVAPNRGPWQVYDIRDRTEQNNLAPRHKALVEQLSEQYRKWAQETHAE